MLGAEAVGYIADYTELFRHTRRLTRMGSNENPDPDVERSV